MIATSLSQGCFSSTLDPEYRKLIDDYRRDYEAVQEWCEEVHDGIRLGIPWKIHILVAHLLQWLDQHTEGMQRFCEQTTEAVHCDFSKTYKRFKRDESHPEHGKNLRRSVVEYSSRRL